MQWKTIADLYARLEACAPSPVVEELAPRADDRLAAYAPWHAAWADLLERAGRPAEAAKSLRRALELAPGEPERRYIGRRLAELEGSPERPQLNLARLLEKRLLRKPATSGSGSPQATAKPW